MAPPGRVPAFGEPASGCAPSSTSFASPRWSRSVLALTVLVVLALCPPTMAASSVIPGNSKGVCVSMDIRNSPGMLHKLKGCRVVEGFLQITLIDNPELAVPAAYANFSFPELTEITGYLLLYRVNGLRNLGDLFPNLAVIGGHKLIKNFALILYEVMHLEEIGLYSLTDITRGSVRIEKNFMLCYVNTIDWDRIAYNGKGEHYIEDNKADNECPWCPGDDSTNISGTTSAKTCPLGSGNVNSKRHLCWNQNNCQKTCPNCPDGVCRADGSCCDKQCLGGCSDNSLSNCTVCRELFIGTLDNRQCVSKCPSHLYKHLDRRCITEEECWNVSRPKELSPADYIDKPYKPLNGTCMLGCPPNYFEVVENNRSTCKACDGKCKRQCKAANVDSIQAAQKLRGCTHIKGSLEISVRGGGNIIKELEEGLGMITDIQGSLKIARSFPLVSLNFLKSLKKIHGLTDAGNVMDTAFTVTDNQNLLDLWDWNTHGPIEIEHGKLFFHFNPKLCYEKIEALRPMAKESEFVDLEVARNSNGDKIACNVTQLNITIRNRTKNGAVISWDPFVYDDPRALLGYVVYSTEAAYQNVTLYDGRDACGGDGWHVDDIQDTTTNSSVYHIMTHLKPYTQYAVYVKTYAIATERLGAQSDIIYIRTLPGQPSSPRNAEVASLDPNSLSLSWTPPEFPNGNITHYLITVKWENDSESLLRQRNYCVEPLTPQAAEKKPVVEIEKPKEKEIVIDKTKCPCDSVNFRKEDDVIADIDFEDLLQNQLYQRRPDVNRRRRDVDGNNYDYGRQFPNDLSKDSLGSLGDKKLDENANQKTYKVENQTSFNITELQHYKAHLITLRACRAIEKDEINATSVSDNCSAKTMISHRTGKLLGADDISGLNVRILSNNSQGIVKITWKEPDEPNSLILTYHIQYKREDIENHAFTTECITRQEFINKSQSYVIKNLNSGNYSIRVMATSLAGNGNYSAFKYFYIEDTGSTARTSLIVGLLTGAFVVVLFITVGYFIYRRFVPPPLNFPNKLIADVNPEYVSTHYVPDEWEVPRSNIELKKELGQGSFGMVYEGLAKNLPKTENPEMRCAIKTINEHATERERCDFLKEASVMKAFDTPHVVRLLGVVSSGLPTLVIMELMAYGDLKSYLRSHRPDQDKPSLARIMQMAIEIADGMSYLAAKKFVHRDLAARNCMVSDNLTVKVGDFGMTRDIYETDYYRKGTKGLLPVRWMSPESLKDGVFTSSSDVWSYGIVLWEMATLAYQPYQGLSNDQVVRYVIDGGVMERPENCPDKLYRLMEMTWQHRPTARPSFLQLVSMLSGDASSEFKTNSFFFSEEGQELYHHTQPAVSDTESSASEPTASTSALKTTKAPKTVPKLTKAVKPARKSSKGIVEEPSRSLSPAHLESSLVHAFLESDSSPPATPRAPTSPPASYRDMIKNIVPFGDKSRGEPHELEALVNTMSEKPAVVVKSSSSPATAPNGYLARPSNNGNPSLLGSLHC